LTLTFAQPRTRTAAVLVDEFDRKKQMTLVIWGRLTDSPTPP
jgi:hypothetical protein